MLAALGDNLTNAEIAERLFISVRTVESHVSALLRKLDRSDRKGLAEIGARLAAGPGTAPPLPDVLVSIAGRGAFAGRTEEQAAIAAALEPVAAGGRQHLVLLIGEAGIGKTRLAAEVAVALHEQERALSIAFGRCDEEALIPYQPFAEVFRAFVDHAPPDVVDRVRPGLSTLLPELRSTETGDVTQARYELLDAVEVVLASIPAPVVVIVDDLHWADRPSLLVIRHLLRSARRLPLLLVGTARRESLGPDFPLAGLLATLDAGDVTHLELGGLAAPDVSALAQEDFPGAAAVAAEAWARTGGNPLLARELLRQIVEEGPASLEAVSPRLRELIARRIARLEPNLVQVLSAGALAGESFRLGVAARAVDQEPDAVLDGLEAAVLAGFVVEVPGEPDRYRFAHALVRHALVQRLTSSRRLHLHLRTAEQLERAGPGANPAEVAHHRHAALPEGDPAAALAAARAAADQAASAVAYEQAAALRGMAIDALMAGGGSEAEEAAERLARAELLLRSGDPEAARAELAMVADVAQRTGDPVLLAWAALGVGEAAARWGFDAELVDLLETTLDAVGDDRPALRARLTARLAQALYYSADAERRFHLAQRAEHDARRSGDHEALAWVLSAQHDALWNPAAARARIESAAKILELGVELAHPELQLRGHGLLMADLLDVGRFHEARAAADRHAALAAELKQPLHLRDAELWRSTWALMDGRLDDAQQAIVEARELSDAARDPQGEVVYWIQQGACAFARHDELDELAAAYARLADEIAHVPAWRSALAAVHLRRGDRDAVAAIFEEQAVDDFGRIPRDGVWMNAITHLADACAYLGDRDRARVLHAALRPYADLVATVDRGLWCKASVSHYLGLLDATTGNAEEARRWFERALERHRAAGAPLLVEETERRLAALS